MNEHTRRSLSSTNVVLGILTALVLSMSSSIIPLTSIITLPAASAQSPPTCEGQTATIVGTSRGETIVGTAGNDVIAALAGNDIVNGNAGDDIICGGSGNDQLNGGDGNDRLIGESGDDELNGDSGTDQLVGSSGTDKANGGAGIDICNAESEISCDEPPGPFCFSFSNTGGGGGGGCAPTLAECEELRAPFVGDSSVSFLSECESVA